jgi:hypothetical protein
MIDYRLFVERADLPRIPFAVNVGLRMLTMVVRRPPVRGTPKPSIGRPNTVAESAGPT